VRAPSMRPAKLWRGGRGRRPSLSSRRPSGPASLLQAEDFEALGEAGIWTGHNEESTASRLRAYEDYVRTGRPRQAAMVALGLVLNYILRSSHSVAMGWFQNARRLLEGETAGPEHGHLSATETLFLFERGDLDTGLGRAREIFEIGRRHGDRNLQVLGLTFQGFALVRLGRVREGMPLLDEAMAGALSNGLGPLATGITYCQTLSVCHDLLEYRRALEWSDAIERYWTATGTFCLVGACRAHHVGLLVARGDWSKGEEEARMICAEESFEASHQGLATLEIGEIRRRSGDLAGAEAAFHRAHELGTMPQPGIALVLLAWGKVDAAKSSIADALAEVAGDRLKRARLLPAGVEIALAAGDVETARRAAIELESIATDFGSTGLLAAAECAPGAVAHAGGDSTAAAQRLRSGYQHWLELEAPYEAARARLLLAEALRATGKRSAAALEARAAKSVLERLGAVPEARRAARALEEIEAGA